MDFLSFLKFSTVSFTANSAQQAVLNALSKTNYSMNIKDIAEVAGISSKVIKPVLTSLYANGIIYEERDNNYSLTLLGESIANHSETYPPNAPNETYDYSIPSTKTYKDILSSLANGSITIASTTPVVQKALTNLLDRGYITQEGNRYELTYLGEAYVQSSNGLKNLSDEYLLSIYNYIRNKHPEYQYIYTYFDNNKNNLEICFNDVRKYIRGGSIDSLGFSKGVVDKVKSYWGGDTIPTQTSVENVLFHQIKYMYSLIDHVRKSTPTMDEIKIFRQYLTKLNQLITPENLSKILNEYQPYSIISNLDLLHIANKIVGSTFPEKLLSDNIYKQISDILISKRPLTSLVFFENDSQEFIANALVPLLMTDKIKQFNEFTNGYDSKQVPTILHTIFEKNKNFSNRNFKGISLHNFEISNVDFSNTNFSNAVLSTIVFNACNLQEVSFNGANFQNVSIINCNIQNADFKNAKGVDDDENSFSDNIGKALNFYSVNGQISQEEKQRVTKQNQKTYVASDLNEEEKQIAKTFIDTVRGLLYKNSAKRNFNIRFSDDTNNKKSEILSILTPGATIPEWLTKDKLVEMMRSGELDQMGITKNLHGRLMGILSQKEREEKAKTTISPEVQKEAEKTKLREELIQLLEISLPKGGVSKNDLINIVPAAATDIRSIIASYEDVLTPHNLEEIVLQLSRSLHYVSNDASPKVSDFKNAKINNFSYSSRISVYPKVEKHTDRNTMGGDYPDSFAVVIEPNSLGVTDPNLKKLIDELDIHKSWIKGTDIAGWGHWKHAIAATRIQPHIVTYKDINSNYKSTKKVWVIVELQSDPNQKHTQAMGTLIDPNFSMPFNLNSNTHLWFDKIVAEAGTAPDNKIDINDFANKMFNTSGNFSTAIKQMFEPDERIADQFVSVLKSFLTSNKQPVIIFLTQAAIGQAEPLKKYPKIKNGEEIIKELLSRKLVEPINDPDDTPSFVDSSGKIFNKFRLVDAQKLTQDLKGNFNTNFVEELNSLTKKKLITYDSSSITLTDKGKKDNTVLNTLRAFRSHYKNWSEMLILETINRAVSLGDIAEIWIASAEDAQSSEGIKSHYDDVAKKFTDVKIPEPFEIRDPGSSIYNNGVNNYYVIDVNKWKSDQKFSSLKLYSSVYTDFIRRYVEKVANEYPYLVVVPTDLLISSAVAYLQTTGQLTSHQQLEDIIEELNNTYNILLDSSEIVPYVTILTNGVKNVDKNIIKAVHSTGEHPQKLAKEIFQIFLKEKFPQLGEDAANNAIGMFNTIVDEDGKHLFGEALSIYMDIHDSYNPNTGGDEYVSPEGETIEGEEEKEPSQDMDIRFDAPNSREMHNLTNEQIDKLLDALKLAEAENNADKINNIKRKLHELSTLGSLKFSVVVHEDGVWKVKTKDRKKTLGKHPSKAKALRQLRAIEWSKHQGSITFADIKDFKDLLNVQLSDGNWNYDPYMHGLANGMILFDAIAHDEHDPKFLDAPDEYLKDIHAALKFSSEDQEFNTNRERNQWFSYEPANKGNDEAPVGGGSNGIGEKYDNSSRDMHGGFYTDLSLPDNQREEKEREAMNWTGRENMQLWASLGTVLTFEFEQFKNDMLPRIKALSSYKNMNNEALENQLRKDWIQFKGITQ